MLAAARNMHERKSKPFDQPRLNAVIATRRDVTSGSLHHFAQCFSFVGCRRFHITFPFSLLWILTQWWQGRGTRLVLFHEEREAHEGFGFLYFELRASRSPLKIRIRPRPVPAEAPNCVIPAWSAGI